MTGMFSGGWTWNGQLLITHFNQPLSHFNVSKVESVSLSFVLSPTWWEKPVIFDSYPNFNPPFYSFGPCSTMQLPSIKTYQTGMCPMLSGWVYLCVQSNLVQKWVSDTQFLPDLYQIDTMFRNARAFNQNMCKWGDNWPYPHHWRSTRYIFIESGCPVKTDPTSASGPWCVACP